MPVLLYNTLLLKAENASCPSLCPSYSGNSMSSQILNQFEKHEESLFSRFYLIQYWSEYQYHGSFRGQKEKKTCKENDMKSIQGELS